MLGAGGWGLGGWGLGAIATKEINILEYTLLLQLDSRQFAEQLPISRQQFIGSSISLPPIVVPIKPLPGYTLISSPFCK
ncbi:MAG: hypothetical protein GDA38_11350 [Hormoscilla sp. SP12CHS1]|nr:hypothetical protein [Hormoscilla sp. SP12CHS1]